VNLRRRSRGLSVGITRASTPSMSLATATKQLPARPASRSSPARSRATRARSAKTPRSTTRRSWPPNYLVEGIIGTV
jgi:hypothetical protein